MEVIVVNSLMTEKMVLLDLEIENKHEVIEKLARILQSEERLENYEEFVAKVEERETTFPTSLGFNFAIPHGKCDAVKKASVAFARLRNEIQWSDEEKAKYIFLIGVSEQEAGDQHLKILAQLSRKIMRDEFRQELQAANTVEEVLEVLAL